MYRENKNIVIFVMVNILVILWKCIIFISLFFVLSSIERCFFYSCFVFKFVCFLISWGFLKVGLVFLNCWVSLNMFIVVFLLIVFWNDCLSVGDWLNCCELFINFIVYIFFIIIYWVYFCIFRGKIVEIIFID